MVLPVAGIRASDYPRANDRIGSRPSFPCHRGHGREHRRGGLCGRPAVGLGRGLEAGSHPPGEGVSGSHGTEECEDTR